MDILNFAGSDGQLIPFTMRRPRGACFQLAQRLLIGRASRSVRCDVIPVVASNRPRPKNLSLKPRPSIVKAMLRAASVSNAFRTIRTITTIKFTPSSFRNTSRPIRNSTYARTMATLTAKIKEDHQEMYEYYDNYVKASGDRDTQTRWANQLFWEVARHAVGEEIVVYPLMEQHLGQKGIELADQDRKEHQYVKEKLHALEGMAAGTPEFDSTLKAVMDHLHKHNDSEEREDLPRLEPALGTEGSKAAGQSFSRTKMFVPTHAHPSFPNKPPYETLAGFMALPADRLKDLFLKFPTEEMKHQS
ncbi:hypothetical protein D9758_013922 [Tetrapyrgos nigripes]|uniref:Hemerythrin-like domain-containing protein n=1 Tax=Tetrapyrgos nigripes TaxID=182062 RepID=A0A8H5CPD7_9AGAR|nr:hypothetical protein D9758_013922 [Tetrapyrgos nigripes]